MNYYHIKTDESPIEMASRCIALLENDYNGQSHTINEWCDLLNIKYTLFKYRRDQYVLATGKKLYFHEKEGLRPSSEQILEVFRFALDLRRSKEVPANAKLIKIPHCSKNKILKSYCSLRQSLQTKKHNKILSASEEGIVIDQPLYNFIVSIKEYV